MNIIAPTEATVSWMRRVYDNAPIIGGIIGGFFFASALFYLYMRRRKLLAKIKNVDFDDDNIVVGQPSLGKVAPESDDIIVSRRVSNLQRIAPDSDGIIDDDDGNNRKFKNIRRATKTRRNSDIGNNHTNDLFNTNTIDNTNTNTNQV